MPKIESRLRVWGHTYIDPATKVILRRVIAVAQSREEAFALVTAAGLPLKNWEFKYWIESGDATEWAVAGSRGQGVYSAPRIGKFEDYGRIERKTTSPALKVWGHLVYAARLFEQTKNGFVYRRRSRERPSRVIVAARSKKQAVEMLNAVGIRMSRYEFDGYWSHTGNSVELLVVEQNGAGVYGAPGIEYPASAKDFQRMEPKECESTRTTQS